MRLEVFSQVIRAVEAGERIYFLDEACFSSKQKYLKAWTRAGMYQAIARDRYSFNAVGVVSVIDALG